MAEYPTLRTQPRTIRGKKVAQLRRDGLTPIVVYGPKTETLVLQTETRDLVKILAEAGGTQLIAIEIEGEDDPLMALARDVQRHVTKLTPIHADFLEVDVTQVITSQVPLVVEGEAPLARQGDAILQLPINSLTVEALPADLPSSITIDGSQFLEFEDALYVRDIDLGEGVRILEEPDDLVARLAPSRMTLAHELEEAEAAAEEEELLEAELAAEEGEEGPAEGAAEAPGDEEQE